MIEQLSAIALALIVSLIALNVARRRRYFQMPHAVKPPFLSTWHLPGIFLTYFATSAAFVTLYVTFAGQPFDDEGWGWLQLGALSVSFIALMLYLLIMPRARVKEIFYREHRISAKRTARDFGLGALSWLISYPIVVTINLTLGLVIYLLLGEKPTDQVAVDQLKETMAYPVLFTCMTLAVSLLVPFMEELLFRGFLQTWIRRFLGRWGGIALTSVIFSAVHFSKSQGASNVMLLTSLFVLSLFLGLLYERQKTLWAPIGLHVAFNALSVLFISLGEAF